MRQAIGLLLQFGVGRLIVAADQSDTIRYGVDHVLRQVGDIQGHGPQIRTCYFFRLFGLTSPTPAWRKAITVSESEKKADAIIGSADTP